MSEARYTSIPEDTRLDSISLKTNTQDLSKTTISMQTESAEELLVRRQRSVGSDVVLFELFKRTKPVKRITIRHLRSTFDESNIFYTDRNIPAAAVTDGRLPSSFWNRIAPSTTFRQPSSSPRATY